MRRLARSRAPVLARWMVSSSCASGGLPSPSRSATCPPIIPPTVPEAVASSAISRVLRSSGAVELGQHLKGQREQRVAGQNRHGIAENFVVGELAAAVIVVIERRQIVVDQRVGVDQFQRAGRRASRHPATSETARAASMHRMGRMRLPPANRL